MAGTSGSTTYRVALAVVLRAIGPLLVLVGFLWLIATVFGAGTGVLLILVAVTVAVVVASALAVGRPPRLLVLSEQGYRVSLLRGAGTPAADWADVESVDSRHDAAGAGNAIVVSLKGNRSTTIPLSLLGPRGAEARREMHDRLNQAYGYRHLDAS